jgi:transcriptional regulator with XRE-family HTH domain
MFGIMPRRSRLNLPPLNLGNETFGQRLARVRKERGYTQVEIAEKIGIIQVLVSNYENDRLRMHSEMIVRFAQALGVSADTLLGLNGKNSATSTSKFPRRLLRRVEQIAHLSQQNQRALLKTVDGFIRGVHP